MVGVRVTMTGYGGTWWGLWVIVASLCLSDAAAEQVGPEGVPFVFAVVSDVSRDRSEVTAQVAEDAGVRTAKLLPIESLLGNPVWRTLEVCHSLRLEVRKVSGGYEVLGVRALDASMLPMPLQSVAGDCLIKKALEMAPMVD